MRTWERTIHRPRDVRRDPATFIAADTFHSPGDQAAAQPVDERDPYINMLGGEFIVHGSQQEATMTVVDSKFPGAKLAAKFYEA